MRRIADRGEIRQGRHRSRLIHQSYRVFDCSFLVSQVKANQEIQQTRASIPLIALAARCSVGAPVMSEFTDFDIPGLAAYLHLGPEQVQKMAERGRLPGRRIQGEWRFSRAEIHHWLEEKIGASGEPELIDVERILEGQAVAEPRWRSLADLMSAETIALPLLARTKNSVIDSICQMAFQAGKLWDPAAMAEAIRARESLHPTALDNGVALMHPRRPLPHMIADSFLALGITAAGIPFGGPRGSLTDVFFLIASYSDAEHLKILARLSRLIVEPTFLGRLRSAATPQEVLTVFSESEESLNAGMP